MKTKNEENKILNGNKLIAEFMGYEYIGYSKDTTPPYGWWKKGTPIRLPMSYLSIGRKHTDLKYHDSWEWIIPVVQKIGKLEFDDTKGLREYMTSRFRDTSRNCEIDIYSSKMDIFNAVVEFIKWYNDTNNSDESDDIVLGGNEM